MAVVLNSGGVQMFEIPGREHGVPDFYFADGNILSSITPASS